MRCHWDWYTLFVFANNGQYPLHHPHMDLCTETWDSESNRQWEDEEKCWEVVCYHCVNSEGHIPETWTNKKSYGLQHPGLVLKHCVAAISCSLTLRKCWDTIGQAGIWKSLSMWIWNWICGLVNSWNYYHKLFSYSSPNWAWQPRVTSTVKITSNYFYLF